MREKKRFVGLAAVLAIAAAIVLMPGVSAAQTESVLYSFGSNGAQRDGELPYSGVIFDGAGNLYGTTFAGGARGGGTVFELSPQAGGGRSEKVLHSFGYNGGSGNGGIEGSHPSAGLIFDSAGNLYGTTVFGGAGNCLSGDYYVGCGIVFELSPAAGGSWDEKILQTFTGGENGEAPGAALVLDSAGNLYGTTGGGGFYGYGTVFELTPIVGAGWTATILHSFGGGDDGRGPVGLVSDAAGNLYGTTGGGGGANACGTVYELSMDANGRWTEKLLHSFGDKFGEEGNPQMGITIDASGNLYGATSVGGAYGFGIIYLLSPATDSTWTESVLYVLGTPGEALQPQASMIIDSAGNLYGTSVLGGAAGDGTVFELSPSTDGSWTETLLHSFTGGGTDGASPESSLIFDAAGNLYGTTSAGGKGANGQGFGTVFEVTR
jgi:uncharacterized repeat protein (TIGR03803 family)